MSKKKYSHTSAIGADGKFYTVSKEVAKEMNRSSWREEYFERKKLAPVKRMGADGELLDFDDKASSRECSYDGMLETGGESHLTCVESFEDDVLDRLEVEEHLEILRDCLPLLSAKEKSTFEGMEKDISSRDYEKIYGVPARTYSYRRGKLEEKLKGMILTEQKDRAAARAKAEA